MTLNAGLSSCSSQPLQEGLNVGWRTEEDDDDARDLHAVAFWRQIHMGRRKESRYVASESKISVAILPTHSTCQNCSPKNVARISTSANSSLSNAATLQGVFLVESAVLSLFSISRYQFPDTPREFELGFENF
jgi:hypothetical protein